MQIQSKKSQTLTHFAMKSKKSDSSDRIVPVKRIDSETVKPSSSIQRNKRRNTTNNVFQRTNQLLHTYNSIFKKPFDRPGDAETYFRQTLRNYDDFELVKTTTAKSEHKFLRQAQSSDSVRKSGRIKTASSSEEAPKPEKRVIGDSGAHLKVLRSEQLVKKELVEEGDFDVFYSPSSEPLDEGLDDIKEVDEREANMAEEEDSVAEEASDVPEEEETDVEDVEEEEEMDEGELDYIEKFEKMVEEAVTELEHAAEDNPELEDAIGSLDQAAGAKEGGDTGDQQKVADKDSVFKYDATINSNILRELEEAEHQAKETAKIIYELKERVAVLVKKEKMTEAEAKELGEKNKLLKDQMMLFEEKTRRIQYLVGQTNLFDKMCPIKPALPQTPQREDMLPKVIVCGMTEDDMPKIIVCNDKRKERRSKRVEFPAPPIPPGCIPQMAQKLSQSYYMQEKLATENAELESMRYNLQEDLLNKDQTVESLQKKFHGLQAEMRMVCKENQILSEKLEKIQGNNQSPCCEGDTNSDRSSKKKMPCGKGKATCPADVEKRLEEYSDTTHQLERQLVGMESEVKNMQQELEAVQKERKHLEHHRRLLCAPQPCPMPPPCMPPPCAMPAFCSPKPPTCPAPCNPQPPTMGISSDTALRELREQYNRLQDDFKGKLTEVAGLRADNEKLKKGVKDAEDAKKSTEDRLKELEKRCKSFDVEKGKFFGSKEQLVEQEQQLMVAKQRFREAQDELEELRALMQDQQGQLDDYRNKYLQAQQQVEEQRRQIDMMEMENSRIAEQVNLEIQRVKNQFQEKLQELTPLPEILKATQLKLQEAQQMHLMAERNNESLVRELQAFKDRASEMENELEKQRSDQMMGEGAKMSLQQQLEQWEKNCKQLEEENEELKMKLAKAEELAEINDIKVQEKLHEIAQLSAQLETVREESARQVARIKDRCETVRRSMQNQIADLERQVAQSRAIAKTAQKDRDEIRQKMQTQINNLNENFEDAQMRIRNLQGHVNFLKTSYNGTFPSEPPMGDSISPCDCRNKF